MNDATQSPSDRSVEMYVPRGKIPVFVFYNKREEVETMLELLILWPNVEVNFFKGVFPSKTKMELGNKKAVVLLDHDLGENSIPGSEIAAILKQNGHTGPIVSISNDEKPDYAGFHFKPKTLVGSDPQATEDFKTFMNQVIAQAHSQ